MIGMFDSGVGGLSILHAVRQRLPSADIVYVADSAWFPYGGRRPEDIRARSRSITRFLLGQGARLVVVACNSASGAAIVSLRAEFELPFVGVEPAVKVAVDRGEFDRIGVLCTEVTAGGQRYDGLVRRVTDGQQIVTAPSSVLAGVVERGEDLLPEADAVVARELAPLLDANVQTVVLGCTHYAFLADHVRRLSGLPILEPSAAVARQVERLYPQRREGRLGSVRLLATGDIDALRSFADGHGLADATVEHLLLAH